MISRRTLLSSVATIAITGQVGCIGPGSSNPDYPNLNIRAEVVASDGRWDSTIRIRNLYESYSAAHGVELLVFDVTGTQLYEESIGDIPAAGTSGPVVTSFTTDAFPAIQTIVADESPCDGARIEINYWDEDVEEMDADGLWRDVRRECDKPLPPQHVLSEADARRP